MNEFFMTTGGEFTPWFILLIIALSIWSITWKGLALWKAAKASDRNWFIALLILNTAGILEIIYIFLIAKKKNIPSVQ